MDFKMEFKIGRLNFIIFVYMNLKDIWLYEVCGVYMGNVRGQLVLKMCCIKKLYWVY